MTLPISYPGLLRAKATGDREHRGPDEDVLEGARLRNLRLGPLDGQDVRMAVTSYPAAADEGTAAPAPRVPVGAAASVWSVGLCGKMLVLNVPFTALEGDGAEGTAGARRAIGRERRKPKACSTTFLT